MINSEAQSKANSLASLARLYPEAYFMAAAANSRSGLTVRRLEIAGLISPVARLSRSLESNRQQSTGGLLAVNPMRV
jgi:hypothetical protein